MTEIHWGSLIVTLLLPLLAAFWLRGVIRRNSLQRPAEAPSNGAVFILFYIVGFALTWTVATFLGLYLLGQMGQGTGAVSQGAVTATNGVALLGVYVGGLWGALLPYRILARNGKTSIWIWLGLGLFYAVLFYISTLILH